LVVQVRELKQKYESELGAYQEALAAARTKEQVKAALDKHPPTDQYAKKFLDLARRGPKTEAAAEALVWVASHPTGPPAADDPRAQALKLRARDHLADDRGGRVCTLQTRPLDPAGESFLRACAKSKNPGVQARATMSLALNRRLRLGLLERLADDPSTSAD